MLNKKKKTVRFRDACERFMPTVYSDTEKEDDGDDLSFASRMTARGRKSDVGDELAIKPRDCARFEELARQLGGLSTDMDCYESHFGYLSDDDPYGDNIWHGMIRLSKKRRWKPMEDSVAWLSHVVNPRDLFDAVERSGFPTRPPSSVIMFLCPAIVYLTPVVDAYVLWQIGCRKPGKNPEDRDFFDSLQIDSLQSDDEKLSDEWSAHSHMTCPVEDLTIGFVSTLCLAHLINSNFGPQLVHSSWLRLWKPVSRL